ncbi:LINE-1 retrotransposable element ORF1 protein [Plecturocebus cupreus]
MDNFEKNISELMELKNTTQELREACTSFNSRIDQAEERISEVEDQLNEIKREGKMTEKSVKRNEQSLQEIWDYVKRPNLRLIGVPECDEENESKLENTLQDIIQENFPNLARQANIQVQEIQRTPQRYSSRRATPRHIIVRFTRVEMKEKMLRAAREKLASVNLILCIYFKGISRFYSAKIIKSYLQFLFGHICDFYLACWMDIFADGIAVALWLKTNLLYNSVYVMNQMYSSENVKPSLNPGDEVYLIMVD